MTLVRDAGWRVSIVGDGETAAQDAVGLDLVTVVALTDLEVDLEHTKEEGKGQGVALVLVGSETKVDFYLVTRTETSNVVCSGTGKGFGQTKDAENRVLAGESNGLLFVNGNELGEVELGLLTESNTTRTVDTGELGPSEVFHTNGTVVVQIESTVDEVDQAGVTTRLSNGKLTVVVEALEGHKTNLWEKRGVGSTEPHLTVVLKVVDINVDLTSAVGLSGVERSLTRVDEVLTVLVVGHRLVVVGSDVQLALVVEGARVGDVTNVQEGEESTLLNVKVVEVHRGQVGVDGVLGHIKTVGGSQ